MECISNNRKLAIRVGSLSEKSILLDQMNFVCMTIELCIQIVFSTDINR